MIRVLIAAIAPAGLESLLERAKNIEVIGSGNDWEQPDVIIADEDGADELLELHPNANLVVLTSDPNPAAMHALLRSGVRAVLPDHSSADQTIAAVIAAAAGLITLRPEDLEPGFLPDSRPSDTTEPLSSRETEVLGMLAEGLSNKLIAHRLGISEHTVKFHVASIMSKLRASSRTEAVTTGIRQGLIML
ncbi:MAG: response regulator transcription factor [Bryobacteraceae bacterium]|jgi:DNA-binding NarL/FixJ family response regulator